MKRGVFLLLVFFSSQLIAQENSINVEGLWAGTYGNNQKDNPYYFSFRFLPDGTMEVINQNQKIIAQGKFSFTKRNLLVQYRYTNDVIQYECEGWLNKSGDSLSGNWHRIEDAGTSGKFTQAGKWVMTRKDSPSGNGVDSLRMLRLFDKRKPLLTNKPVYDFSTVTACIDYPVVNSRPLPPRTPSNAVTHYRIDRNGNVSDIGIIRQPLAGYTDKMWEPGQEITVAFYIVGASVSIIENVKAIAKEWEQYANIKLVFVQSYADALIRVGFVKGSSYSLIGRDVLLEDPAKATMNFGWLLGATQSETRRVVLHEFGHALGFIHEHQTFGNGIPWDREKVYAYYAQQDGYWTKEAVDQNVFYKYSYSETNYSSFDRHSIMQYPVPKELTTDSSSIEMNRELSATDKQYAALFYPFPAAPPSASGTLLTGDDCDEITFQVDYNVVPSDRVEFNLQFGQTNGTVVTWWKQIGIPLLSYPEQLIWIQNHSLIKSENKTADGIQLSFEAINKNGYIRFWKAKVLGAHTLLPYRWDVLKALQGGCRVTLTWRKDRCL